jgi:UDP-N-acetylmuramate--alanine ligase
METEDIRLEDIKKIYFIGIGGIGMSAVARFMRAAGKEVLGSDLKPSRVTLQLESLGITIHYGQKEENITDGIDLAVYTVSIPADNPERKKVTEKGIPAITYARSLGLIFNGKRGIAVCGTHGKSTTTAMIGYVLEDGGVDPTVLVGSIVPRYGSNLHLGGGQYFVAEACEYGRNFLSLYPQIIVLNNIELDHTDCYADITEMKESFRDFLSHLPADGTVFCGDDENIRAVMEKIRTEKPGLKVFYFGTRENDDFCIKDFKNMGDHTEFEAYRGSESLGLFRLRVPGEFNAKNALASIALGIFLGISAEKIRMSLESYGGIWRRFEIKGEYRGALVISDYAHHPTAVRNTIEAAKGFYAGRRIFAVFQPHQHNRTRGLYRDFLECFDAADEVVVSEIYDVAGREEKSDQNVSSGDIVRDVEAKNAKLRGHITYARDMVETRRLIDEKLEAGDILLVMGAGDIFEIADSLAGKG